MEIRGEFDKRSLVETSNQNMVGCEMKEMKKRRGAEKGGDCRRGDIGRQWEGTSRERQFKDTGKRRNMNRVRYLRRHKR